MKKLTSNFKFLAVIGLCVTSLAVASTGCGDNSSCASADDCYAGESCIEGVCEVDSNNGNNGNNGNNNGTTPANNGTTPANNGTTPANNGTTPANNGTTPANNGTTPTNNGTTPTNNGTTPTNNGTTPALACIVDKFSSCDDPYEIAGDRNDTWSNADYLRNSAGCVGDRDLVIPRTWTADGTLCHLEPADFYNMTIVPCDNTTLVAEARFHPKTMCLPEHFVFNFNRGTAPISCNDAGVSCSMDGEDHIIQKLVPPESTVLSFYASVSNIPDGTVSINLDYTLTVSVSGP